MLSSLSELDTVEVQGLMPECPHRVHVTWLQNGQRGLIANPLPREAPMVQIRGHEEEPVAIANANLLLISAAPKDDSSAMFYYTAPLQQPCKSTVNQAQDLTCYICLYGDEDDLLRGGCACRGTSGLVHLSCAIQAAQSNKTLWRECLTCKQEFTGKLRIGLARGAYELTEGLPAESRERMMAALEFTDVLTVTTVDSKLGRVELAEALQIGRSNLEALRRVHGDHDATVWHAMGTLAMLYDQMGEHSLALPLREKVHASRQRAMGDDNESTITAAANLANSYIQQGKHSAVLALLETNPRAEKRLHGIDHEGALRSMVGIAMIHETMGRHDLALPLMRKAVAVSQRVLGPHNVAALHYLGHLGELLSETGDLEEAIPMLKQASVGFTAALGADHRKTSHIQKILDAIESLTRQGRLHDTVAHVVDKASFSRDVFALPSTLLHSGSVTVLRYLKETGCYRVKAELSEEYADLREHGIELKKQVDMKPAEIVLRSGTALSLMGLTGAPELNGQAGMIIGFDKKAGRYIVRMARGGKNKKVKPESCIAVAEN